MEFFAPIVFAARAIFYVPTQENNFSMLNDYEIILSYLCCRCSSHLTFEYFTKFRDPPAKENVLMHMALPRHAIQYKMGGFTALSTHYLK